MTDLLTAADGDVVPCHCPAQRTRRSCFEALLETSAVLVLAALLATKWLDTDATDEARSLTVVTVRVLCGSCCALAAICCKFAAAVLRATVLLTLQIQARPDSAYVN